MQSSPNSFIRSTMRAMVLVAALTAIPLSAFAATPFVHESVLAGFAAGFGENSSLALDTQGNPAISYYEPTFRDLVFSRKAGGVWYTDTVVGTGTVGRFSSLAIDAQNTPHIAYYDSTNGDLAYAKQSAVSDWVLQSVDVTGNVGDYVSIALDPQGLPRIAYHDVTNDDLKMARFTGASWGLETVEAGVSTGYYTSIAVDAQGAAHISYFDGVGLDLKYATKTGSVWSKEVVDATGTVGSYSSIALDRQGRPRISYWDLTNGDLKYASKTGSVWTIEVVDATPGVSVGPYTSLELDADGNPRISYKDETNLDLKFASKNAGVWTIETLDANGNVGGYTSLALDAQGNPCISYQDGTGFGLKYTDSAIHLLSPVGGERWAAGSEQTIRWSGAGTISVALSENGGLTWATLLASTASNSATIIVPQATTERARVRISRASPASTAESQAGLSIAPDLVNPWWSTGVDAVTNFGSSVTLALDVRGNPRIGYFDSANGDLRYASKTGAVWSAEIVDAAGVTGNHASLALDAQGQPQISYFDDTNDDLRFASKSGSGWNIETVDALGSVGIQTSLALDGQGNPNIAYFDLTNDRLKYASKSAGAWTLQTVGLPATLGSFDRISLALDSQANPYITYGDNSTVTLMSRQVGTWNVEIIDTFGFEPAVAIDAQGNPHVAYIGGGAEVTYARASAAGWTYEATGIGGNSPSLVLDGAGHPHIGLRAPGVIHASKAGGAWTSELAVPNNALGVSFALDAQGNGRFAYIDNNTARHMYASAAIEIGTPSPSAVWPVGASRTLQWDGTGRVDLSLSVDGGNTWQPVQSRLTEGTQRIQVPHAPSRFAVYKLERQIPYSVAVTDLFTIESSIALLNFTSKTTDAGGVALSWQSDPGPSDLSGYRLEKAGAGGDWQSLVPMTRETTYTDPAATAGARYRLFGVNGLGDEILLGETSVLPTQALAAWPLPYRGGDMNVSFALFGQLGAAQGVADVALYDASGRLVRTLATGTRSAGQHVTRWDGRDDAGNAVSSGVYFLRSKSAGSEAAVKVTVLK